MSAKSFRRIDDGIAAGVEPTVVARSGRIVLKAPGGTVGLASAAGKLTNAGKRYYEKTGKERPNAGYDPSRGLDRDGAKEYVAFRDGSRRLARTWDPSTNDFLYTKLGKSFFAARGEVEEFVVHIPVRIFGTNKKTGKKYERTGHLPHQALTGNATINLPKGLSQAEKDSRLKAWVMRDMAEILLEVSDEQHKYHADGAWRISQLTTRTAEDNQISVNAVMNRPLQHGKPEHFSHLSNSWAFDPSAFDETDGNCVVHQLCCQLELDKSGVNELMEELQNELYGDATGTCGGDDIFEGCHWSLKGCTARMLVEFCKRMGKNCHILWGNSLIESWVNEKRKHGTNICACIWGSHLYMVKDPNVKHSIALSNPRVPLAQKTEVLARPFQGSALSLDNIEPWEACGGIKPGNFWTTSEEIQDIQANMIANKTVPVVRMRDFLQTKSLELRLPNKDKVTVTALPLLWMEIQEFAAHLAFLKKEHITYRGEGLASFTLTCLITLMRPSRTSLETVSGFCEKCGAQSSVLQKDHIVPVALGGTSEGQNLCMACHFEKTRTEGDLHRHCRGAALNPLMSYFNPETYQQFLQNKPLALVCRANKPQGSRGTLVDVKRCRRNALTSGWSLPVFCALDEVRAFEIDRLDSDFFFVSGAKGGGCAKLLEALPWTGPRWYHRCNVEYLLETNRITLDHIKFCIKASGHLAADAFVEPLRAIETAWSMGESNLGKQAINSAIGLMGARENFVYRCVMSKHEHDSCLLAGPTAERKYGSMHQWVSRTKLLETWSMLPVHLFCMDMERLRVAQIVDFAARAGVPPRCIIEFRTDSVMIEHPKAKAALENVRLEDLKAIAPRGKAFTVESQPIEDPPAGFNPVSSCPEPDIDYSWNCIVEDQDATEAAREIVLSKGESLLVLGPGGTGKSSLVTKLVKELREAGHRVVCTALTHVASRVIQGQTLASFIYRYILNGSFTGWLVVDEISLLGVSVLNHIVMLTQSNVRFILMGDMFQLHCPCDVWAGKTIEDNGLDTSRLLHILSGGNVIHLTKCRRSSGGLFEFYTSLYPTGSLGNLPVHEMVQIAKRTFPRQKRLAQWNLCISHAKRQTVNKLLWDSSPKDEVLDCKLSDEIVDGVFVGAKLIGNTTSKSIIHGAFYVVLSWNATHVQLRDSETEEEAEVTISQMKCFRLGWAITYAAVQGRTLRDSTRLFDTGHKFFTARHLAMGLGRVVHPKLIDLA